jgi:anti-sigma factor RsiW
MDCERLRDELLDDPGGNPAHLAECPACAAFAARQRALDADLARVFRPPSLSPSFRPALRARVRRERTRAWMEALPDIVHFASCGAATLACAAFAPLAATTVLTSGIAIALGSYVITTALRQSINALEQLDR